MAGAHNLGVMTGRWPEGPWALLGAASLAAPLAVLAQGGSIHVALLAGLACLGCPGAAIESMLALARLAMRIEGRPD